MTPDDLDVMARTLFGEARGEPLEGKIAVAWVIRNRADHPGWWGSGIAGVCKQDRQFSCWNENDPNRAKLLAGTPKDEMFRECLAAVAAVLSDNVPDPTQGSMHYKVSTLTWPGDWGPEKEPVLILGNHAFYNNVK